LSRTKAADDPLKKQEIQEKQKKKLPELEDFIQKRDYSGAIALLEVLSNLFFIKNSEIKKILIISFLEILVNQYKTQNYGSAFAHFIWVIIQELNM